MNWLVFLVDDDEDDRMFIREALEAAAPEASFIEAEDGAQLMDLLTVRDPLANPIALLPDLIVLDMNMPRMTGMDALRKIRAAPDLQGIPTVMLSTSSNPDLIQDALANGVQAYLVKPKHYTEYEEMARSLASRYLMGAE